MPRKKVYVRITVSLRQDDVKELDQVAERMGLPRSALVRLACLEYLRQQAVKESG